MIETLPFIHEKLYHVRQSNVLTIECASKMTRGGGGGYFLNVYSKLIRINLYNFDPNASDFFVRGREGQWVGILPLFFLRFWQNLKKNLEILQNRKPQKKPQKKLQILEKFQNLKKNLKKTSKNRRFAPKNLKKNLFWPFRGRKT